MTVTTSRDDFKTADGANKRLPIKRPTIRKPLKLRSIHVNTRPRENRYSAGQSADVLVVNRWLQSGGY
jgi:hypothetical protein